MPTWGQYQAQAELKANRAAQDTVLRERHRAFDLQAQDKTPKSARHHFAVVGEGSRSSQEQYRQNYDRIFHLPSRRLVPALAAVLPAAGAVAAGSPA